MEYAEDFDDLVIEPVGHEVRCLTDHEFAGADTPTRATDLGKANQALNSAQDTLDLTIGYPWVRTRDIVPRRGQIE
jgi:hypothetical protein